MADFLTTAWNALTYVGYVLPFINGGYSYWQHALKLMTPAMPVPNPGGITRTITGNTTARRVIYGRRVVGGTVAFWGVTGHQQNILHMVVVFAAHEVDAIEAVYLDGRQAGGGTYSAYLGASDQAANSAITTAFPSQWTDNHRLRGLAYVYIVIPFNQSLYPSGIPNITARIRGKKLYDPRTDVTEWSPNPALALRDWLLLTAKASADRIDDDLVSDAADRCDELIDGYKRHTCNGMMELMGSPKDGAEALAASMGGALYYRQGKWRMYASSYEAPTLALGVDDLAGPVNLVARGDKAKICNVVRGTYCPADLNNAEIDFPPIKSPDLQEDDLEELADDIKLPFTDNNAEAQRLAKLYLLQSRSTISVKAPFKYTAVSAAPFSRVSLTLPDAGWTDKVFRVQGARVGCFDGVELELVEDYESVWDWTPGEEIVYTLPPASDLPDPLIVDPPSSLAVDETLYVTQVQGAYKVRAVLTWTEGAYIETYAYDVMLDGVIAGPSTRDTSWTFDDIAPGSHIFKVRGINNLGSVGDWVEYGYTVLGKDAPPNPPQAVLATVVRDVVTITISHPADVDLFGYEIRVGTSWEDGVDIGVVSYPGDNLSWKPTTSGALTFWVRSLDTSGFYSTTATGSTTIAQTPPEFPLGSAITQEVIDNNVLLKWPAATGGTYSCKGYRISKGTDYNTATTLREQVEGLGELLFETTGGTYKYWVTPLDIFDNDGAPLSVYATVSSPPDYVLRSNITLALDDGTKTNCFVDADGALIIPVSTTETFAEHFTNNSWTTIQDQIDDGYTIYAQPGLASGSWEMTVDYETTLSSKITLDVTRETLGGTITVTPTISLSDDNVNWTDYADQYVVYGTEFRYVKYLLELETADGGVAKVSRIGARLDVKEFTIARTVNVTDTTGDGTQVDFADWGITPIDVLAIVAGSPYLGTSADPVRVAVNFTDAPDPTSFKVLVWDKNLNRITADNVPVTIRYI